MMSAEIIAIINQLLLNAIITHTITTAVAVAVTVMICSWCLLVQSC